MIKNQDKKIIKKILDMLETIKIYLHSEGGDVDFVGFNNGKLKLKILGKCVKCPYNNDTFDVGVKHIIMQEIKQVKEVIFIR